MSYYTPRSSESGYSAEYAGMTFSDILTRTRKYAMTCDDLRTELDKTKAREASLGYETKRLRDEIRLLKEEIKELRWAVKNG